MRFWAHFSLCAIAHFTYYKEKVHDFRQLNFDGTRNEV